MTSNPPVNSAVYLASRGIVRANQGLISLAAAESRLPPRETLPLDADPLKLANESNDDRAAIQPDDRVLPEGNPDRDGERVLVFTHSGKEGMREAYRFTVDGNHTVRFAKDVATG